MKAHPFVDQKRIGCLGASYGGFMTMLGMTLLNDLYSTDNMPAPDLALEMMRKRVITSLDQKLEYAGRKDGMDIILCIFDKKTLILEFASANQPLYIIRNGECKGKKPYGNMEFAEIHTISL